MFGDSLRKRGAEVFRGRFKAHWMAANMMHSIAQLKEV
jgi:hypothetical protein